MLKILLENEKLIISIFSDKLKICCIYFKESDCWCEGLQSKGKQPRTINKVFKKVLSYKDGGEVMIAGK